MVQGPAAQGRAAERGHWDVVPSAVVHRAHDATFMPKPELLMWRHIF